jgi:hypothetical protein
VLYLTEAGTAVDGKFRSKWVKRFLKRLIRDAQDLDTTQDHRESISALLEICLKEKWTSKEASWNLVFSLLMLLAGLMGYQGMSGRRTYLPMYWQDQQTHADFCYDQGQYEKLEEEFLSASRVRLEVVKYLKDRGLSDFKVAMALKTSEYEIKKLKKS